MHATFEHSVSTLPESSTPSVSRRQLVLSGSAALVGSLLPRGLLAQGATSDADPNSHDHGAGDRVTIPEVELIGNADGLVFPESVEAGLNKVSMINNTGTEMHVFTMRIPDDVTDEELEASMASEALPDWWLTTLFTGNPDQAAPGGGSATGYVVYQPGKYVIENPFNGQMTWFEATGEPWGHPAPIAGVDIGLVDMTFDGFDAALPTGPHLWRVTNHGMTWHDVTVLKAPDGSTVDDLLSAFAAIEDEETIFPEGYQVVGGVGAMSPGVTAWIDLDLAAGTPIGARFLPTLEGNDAGTPHAFLGMMTSFEVA